MATIQERNKSFRIQFLYHGKRHGFTVGVVPRDEAESKAQQVDYLLMRLKQRLAAVPPGMDIVEYVQFDGKAAPTDAPSPQKLSLTRLRDRYLETRESSLEDSTVYGMKIHFGHLAAVLGPAFPIAELSLADLQRYVDCRKKARGRNGRKLSAATIKKEIVTLRTVWNWALKMKLVSGRFPYDGLSYPRTSEKPPFQTMAEIARRLPGIPKAEQAELWHSVYLLLPEIDELLKSVKVKAMHPWIYPLFVFAAHTGARRSEIIRARIHDIDFAGSTIVIREKKRVHGKNTTRRVPMTPLLAEAIKAWLAEHPGGEYLFCKGTIRRSRLKKQVSPLTRTEIHDHFIRTLAGTKWANVKGLHAFRHSMASNLAMKGIDQRLINEVLGHMTPEQEKRYRHLAPNTKAEAFTAVFG